MIQSLSKTCPILRMQKRNSLQIPKVAADILNKWPQTVNKE